MPRLELVSHALCPYVQRAVIALAEKGAPFTRTVVDLASKPDWFTAISPLGRVPLLKVDDAVLFESAVICDYLDETVAPRLHPEDPLERARHRAWIEVASSLLNDIWRLYTAPDAPAFDARLRDVAARLDLIEGALDEGPWFGGERFSLVDAAFGPAFRYFDVFETVADLDIAQGRPKVAAWRAALRARLSVAGAVAPDYPARLLDFVAAQGGHMAGLIARPRAAA
jgi:glutathione S-transferase